MAKIIKSMNDLKGCIDSICKKAIHDTAKEVEAKLRQCIQEQYYNDSEFYPNVYERTETFLNSVASQMLSSNLAQIYIYIEGMHYKNNFSPCQVVSWASESKHGADYYQTTTIDFWTTFTNWCNGNLLDILKKNFKKYGLNIR